MTNVTRNSNRLATQASRYLLENRHDPIDWYPWGEEALALARNKNKAILLSVGYSACHWCQVMAKESFSDPEVAQLINEHFVAIKVDREERPDIDRLYQSAHQLITQRPGGWPLTLFLTPDGELPFFGGTYFPRRASHGMPAFTELLQRVAQFYESDPDKARAQGEALREVYPELEPPGADNETELTQEAMNAAREQLAQRFDPVNGGFNSAPKFPNVSMLNFLLEYWRESANGEEPDVQAL